MGLERVMVQPDQNRNDAHEKLARFAGMGTIIFAIHT
jgi:hypothetical protein